jgi:hypothetical protein
LRGQEDGACVDRALVKLHVEALFDHPLQVHPLPARRPTSADAIDRPVDPFGVVAMDPVAQRLTIHSARRRRLGARGTFQNHRKRQ